MYETEFYFRHVYKGKQLPRPYCIVRILWLSFKSLPLSRKDKKGREELPLTSLESGKQNYLRCSKSYSMWCTKRVKSTDTGRPVFQKYGSTRKNTGRPVNLRVDPYFCGSTRTYTGRPVFLRVDPYICGSTRIFTGRPVFYVSTCIYGSTRNIRVDPYFTGRPVS